MAAARKRIIIRRKVHALRPLLYSNSAAKKRSAVMDAFLCVLALQLKLEAGRRDRRNRIKQPPVEEVKVEKMGEGFSVTVRSESGRDLLVSILEAFEELRLDVRRAAVSRNGRSFAMEAAVVGAPDLALDVGEVTGSVLRAICEGRDE